MSKKIYFLSEKMFYGNTAGTKARNDLEVFLSERYEKIGPQMVAKIKKNIFYYIKAFIKSKIFCHKLRKIKDSKIIFQYPVTRGKVLNKHIKAISKNNEIIFFIHDVNYLRNEELNKIEEIEFMNCASIIVCHNNKMRDKLIADGLNVKNVLVLNCFDYIVKDQIVLKPYSRSVVYAGSLDKGGFLGKLSQTKFNYDLCLFGPNYNLDDNSSIKYCGCFTPDEVPYKLNSAFGLIWDSLDIDTCTGKLGYYTQFNNPHKMSLYLVSGMPVIAWSKSAIADFIESNNIGFTVDSLNQIDEKLATITPEKYNEYQKNIIMIQSRIKDGFYTKTILDEIEKI